MSDHTPGPWRYYYTSAAQARADANNGTDGGGAAGSIQAGSFGEAGTIITFLPHHRDPSEDAVREANARLMATAPELLEALKGLLSYTHACEDMAYHDIERLNVEPIRQVRIARQAIAKATGKPWEDSDE